MKKSLALEDLEKNLQKRGSEIEQETQKIKQEKLEDFKESLREYINNELDTIEEDMTKRAERFKKKLTPIRKEILEEEERLAQEIEETREEIISRMTKLKMRQWLIPTIIGMSIVIGLGIGSLALGKWISSQYQEISELSLKIADQKKELQKIEKAKGKYIKKAWRNGIGVKKEPIIFHSIEENLWIVQFEKSKGN